MLPNAALDESEKDPQRLRSLWARAEEHSFLLAKIPGAGGGWTYSIWDKTVWTFHLLVDFKHVNDVILNPDLIRNKKPCFCPACLVEAEINNIAKHGPLFFYNMLAGYLQLGVEAFPNGFYVIENDGTKTSVQDFANGVVKKIEEVSKRQWLEVHENA